MAIEMYKVIGFFKPGNTALSTSYELLQGSKGTENHKTRLKCECWWLTRLSQQLNGPFCLQRVDDYNPGWVPYHQS